MVPEGWKRASGEDIAEKITKGQSPKWQGFDYQDHGTLFVTSENVREGYLDISKPKYLPIAFNKKLKGSQLRKGDLLINIVGASIGRSCMFDLDVEHANINQAVCLFRTNPQVRSEYIIQYLQLPTTIDKLLGTQTESARPNLSLGDMRDFLFLVPPLSEQKKIAKILSTWDQTITATEHLLENSQQRKKALMQQLLTGKKRLPGFEGEWENSTLTQHCSVVTGNKDLQNKVEDGEYPFFVRSSNIERIDSYSFDGEAILIPGDGRVGEIFHYINGRFGFHQRVYKLSDFKGALGLFIYYYLKRFFKAEVIKNSVKATVDSLRMPVFTGMRIKLPSLEEQQLIIDVLSCSDKEIQAISRRLNLLRQEKKALMQQLLTGKQRVKGDAVSSTEEAVC
ncbi:restriction endonuclease subunit S [Vreelandella salicampi]|uniref:Restriction endonuclease subunit S n=1 Tax=Vreelandella salicampi TaxID=1449798 RepID=A0A7Z0LLD5_9GAMM|nr:restriction endonuclease subunit S [Halomonas salicampi]NYS61052.1 restriction endonuclease subunit S [Halomonas salicampi]